MDRIVIKDFEVNAHIGVTEAERARPQRLLITVELERALARAGRTDETSATTRYDLVADLIRQVATQRPRQLIEAMAEDLAKAILSAKHARAVTVEVKKFSLPRTQHVSVVIRRPARSRDSR